MSVSVKTSRLLFLNDFPQPVPSDGQTWYDRYNNLCVISCVQGAPGSVPEIACLILGDSDTFSVDDLEEFVFAPTATDILRMLPGCALACEGELWAVFYYPNGVYASDWHESPAEAAAQAWLACHEK